MATEKRLIDAKSLVEICELVKMGSKLDEDCCTALDLLIDVLNQSPTVDAVEVVHGRWIEKVDMVESYLADCTEVFHECSVCEAANIGESPYCPNCGAKMDGDGNG